MSIPTPEALQALLGKAAPATALPAHLMHAAVLLPVFERDGRYHVVLTRRSSNIPDAGVICFPGGGFEASDPDLNFTALRETHEEIGVAPEDVRVLGALEPFFTRFGYAIHPVVGLIPAGYPYQPSEFEVDEIIEPPLDALYDPANLRHEGLLRPEGLVKRFTYVYEGRIIYGVTAQMLSRFLELIAEGTDKEVPWQSRTPA
ncbi:MAG: CoA pyrophosphatase [Chloroflexota bacterium]|nr:CoA pyrophosphatase [Chloroflexota bacterium]MDE2970328.1 CoA pyrophosphatase [Chloroflexota bacterium]